MSARLIVVLLMAPLALPAATAGAEPADVIVHHGKIVTVDGEFHVVEAMAVRGDRIVATGGNEAVRKLAGPKTEQVDLHGRTVLPGLIDSHAHPMDAALYEFDHVVPQMDSVADVLQYIKSRAAALPEGQWIRLQQVFVTRLREHRFPTRRELDEAAPRHPVVFRTGADAALNSLALKLSGIGPDYRISDGKPGQVERDPQTGELTGILRSCTRLIKYQSPEKTPAAEQRCQRLRQLMAAYNEAGITGVTDRKADGAGLRTYQALRDRGQLTCRVYLTYYVDAQSPWKEIEAEIRHAATHNLHRYDNRLWLHGLKIYLDGGMLTGSAYMRRPWGMSDIYSIHDPDYRGVLFLLPERLYRTVWLAMESGLQPTAHCVGDAAVDALVAAYERVNRDFPVREKRPCISHGNFMSREAIETMQRVGIVADMQPVWLYLDGAILVKQFGRDRLEYFQPFKTLFERGVIVGGGSDHMQKIGSLRSINPYNPFLGMWTTLRRLPRWTDQPLHAEQALTRQQAIRLYTINCAYLTFEEKEKGSLEPGKLADFIVLDRDILTCDVDAVKDTVVEETWLGGKPVFRREGAARE